MKIRTPLGCSLLLVVGAGLAAAPALRADDDKKPKPSISVRASPSAGFSPLRIVVSAELRGGTNDYEAFYCPSVEWTWGDDTRTETSADCDPYEAGKSEIQRRYTTSKIFQTAGEYKVEFRLKQKNKVVGSGSITVQVRPGVRDGGAILSHFHGSNVGAASCRITTTASK